jgi:hypothetical protein
MQTKKIFLASSEELRADRMAFKLMIGQLNQDWVPRGTFFHLVVWENFIDAMSKDGLQQEYNKAIRDDRGTRAAYAADASNYRLVPIAVVTPRAVADVVWTAKVCARHHAPILPRGGGTSSA